jgi:hypothetical protein
MNIARPRRPLASQPGISATGTSSGATASNATAAPIAPAIDRPSPIDRRTSTLAAA